MNIYVYNCSNTYNYGSMMMGENFISRFNEETKEKNKYFIETPDEVNIERLIFATGYSDIVCVKMDTLFQSGISNYDYILGYFRLKKITSDFINKIDLVVVLGGDDYTEDYGWKGPILNAMKFNMLKRLGAKVVMLGQSMGPYQSFRLPIMKKLLSNINKIYIRDPLTYDILKKMKLKNIAMMDDLALLPLSKQEVKDRTKEYITYCPSELIYKYSKEGKRDDWIDFNLFMINTLMNKYPDKKLVILAHVLKPEHVDDRLIVNELYELVKNKHRDNIITITDEMYPYQVRNYIQQSFFTVSSRMHPVISSIQCEIPAIALSYSTKYWGIIGKRYELDDYIIDIRYLSYSQMKAKFIQLNDKIGSEYELIQEKMKKKNILATDSIKSALQEMKFL